MERWLPRFYLALIRFSCLLMIFCLPCIAFQSSSVHAFSLGKFIVKVESLDNPLTPGEQQAEILSGIGWIDISCGAPPSLPGSMTSQRQRFDVVDTVTNPRTQIPKTLAEIADPQSSVGSTLEVVVQRGSGLNRGAQEVVAELLKQRGYLRVRFQHVKLALGQPSQPIPKAIEGEASFPGGPRLESATVVTGPLTIIYTNIHFNTNRAVGTADVRLPSTIINTGHGSAATLHLAQIPVTKACKFHIQSDETYGPWAIGETGIQVQGSGWILDLDDAWSAPGTSGAIVAPTWRGLVLGVGQTLPASGPPTSNTGYLQARYSYTQALVDETGFSSKLTLNEPFTFSPLEPMNYQIVMGTGWLQLTASRVTEGNFQDTAITLPGQAVQTPNGSLVRLKAPSLKVGDNLDLEGEVTGEQELQWGYPTPMGLKSYNANTWDKGYFLLSAVTLPTYWPLDTSGGFSSPTLTRPPASVMRAWRIQGAMIFDLKRLVVATQDTPGAQPLVFYPNATQAQGGYSWLQVVTDGVNGAFTAYDLDAVASAPSGNPELGESNRSINPFFVSPKAFMKDPNSTFRLDMGIVNSSVVRSGIQGAVIIGPNIITPPIGHRPSVTVTNDTIIPFNRLQLTSTANAPAGLVNLKSPANLDYWGVTLVQNPQTTFAGVLGLKTGRIIITAAGISEPRHFAKPFALTWGEFLADGNLGRLFFDYNNPGQQFDGLGFTTQAVRLSSYDPSTIGFLQVGGITNFDFFGGKYHNIIDFKASSTPNTPFDGRRIEFSMTPDPVGFQATDFRLARNWSDVGSLEFTLTYDDTDQDGFRGVGHVGMNFFEGRMPATITINRTYTSMCARDDNRRDFTLGPVVHLGGMARTIGCINLEGGALKRAVFNAELETDASLVTVIRSAGKASTEVSITPETTESRVEGDLSLSLGGQGDLDFHGSAHFTVHRGQEAGDCLDGEFQGAIDAATALGSESLRADGQLNWHVGHRPVPGNPPLQELFQSLQGRLAVQVISSNVGNGVEGGLYIGSKAPQEEAWVLQNSPFPLVLDLMPKYLTGIYGYARYTRGINLWVVSGGMETAVGLGGFIEIGTNSTGRSLMSSALTGGLPFVVGEMGMRVWGDILGGIVSADASGDLVLTVGGPYPPFSFQGSLDLEGCVAVVGCASVKVTCGLNSAKGFFVY